MNPDPQRIAAAVQSCPAVAGLHGGIPETIVTYLPEGRLIGIAIEGTDLLIGVVGRYPAGVSEIARQVRAAVAELAPQHRIVVSVEELHIEHRHLDTPSAPPPRGTPAPDTPDRGGGRHRRAESDELP